MSTEGPTREQTAPAAVGVLPALKAVVVARPNDVEALIRSSRSEIAKLSLALREALHEAAEAERMAGIGGESVNVLAAHEVLGAALEPQLVARQNELAAEVERVREDAARLVRAVEAEAARLRAEARDELMEALLRDSSPERPPAGPTPATDGDALWRPAQAAETPEPSARKMVDPPPAPPPSPSPSPRPTGAAAPAVPGAAFAGLFVLPLPATPPAVATAVAAATRWGREHRRSLKARLLHADIMLPLIAAVIVLIVLLAWIP